MSEFEKARDEKFASVHYGQNWKLKRIGADWAYDWVLNNEESVMGHHTAAMDAVYDAKIYLLTKEAEALVEALCQCKDLVVDQDLFDHIDKTAKRWNKFKEKK